MEKVIKNIKTRNLGFGKCPRCKEYYLKLKRGKYSLYLCCENFPRCRQEALILSRHDEIRVLRASKGIKKN